MRARRLVSGSSVLTSHSLRVSRPGIASMAATIWAYGGWVGACFSITLMTLETRRYAARSGRRTSLHSAYHPRPDGADSDDPEPLGGYRGHQCRSRATLRRVNARTRLAVCLGLG